MDRFYDAINLASTIMFNNLVGMVMRFEVIEQYNQDEI